MGLFRGQDQAGEARRAEAARKALKREWQEQVRRAAPARRWIRGV
jgi:hypothetical protein